MTSNQVSKLARQFDTVATEKESAHARQKEFLERQKKFVQDRQSKKELIAKDVQSQFPFNPKLCKKSRELMEKSPSRNIELIKAQVAIAKQTQRLLGQHNFKPQADQPNKPSSQLYDRLYKDHLKKLEEQERKREQLKSEMEKRSLADCTF